MDGLFVGSFVVVCLYRLCYVSARPVEAVQNLFVFGSDLLLSVITASAPEVEMCVFKPWVAASSLEDLRHGQNSCVFITS